LKFFTNPLLLEFVMGILIFKLSQYWKFKSLISFSFVTIGVLLIVYVNNLADFGERVICYGLPSFIFFLGMFNLEEKFRGIYQTRFGSFFAKIGDSSYSLYLVHPFILTPVAIILKKLGVNQFGYVFVTLLVIAAVLSGFACHYFLEKPLSRILKTNRSK
ncbi:MAG: acyltransferase, partial [Proteobacteria bacterium]|nr:acyltransferase [Pseudomonadota bacterium]